MQRPLIHGLPEDVRAWLKTELLARGFGQYDELTAALNEKLAEKGFELRVGRTAVYKFGRHVQETLNAMQETADVSRIVAEQFGDDDGAVNDAIQRMVHNTLFRVIASLGDKPDIKELTKLGHVVADLGRASIAQKKWQTTFRAKLEKAAGEIEADVKEAGLSDEKARLIREKLFGIV